MHDKPGSVFRANRGQQEVTLLAADMHDLCAVTQCKPLRAMKI